jgi:hypothetical protein
MLEEAKAPWAVVPLMMMMMMMLFCVGRGLCYGLITIPGVSYLVSNVCD